MEIEAEDLAQVIAAAVMEYSEEVDDAMKECIEELTEEVMADIKANSNIPKRTGKYKRSFYFKTVASGSGFLRNKIANRQHQLTHLLENGHKIVAGGGKTRAFPHWARAQAKADSLPYRIRRKLSWR